jgi:hypothetical protein
MRLTQDSFERIRHHEVSRTLKKVNLSPEEVGIIALLSRSIVGKLLDGPISEILARAEAELSFGNRHGPEAPRGLDRYGGASKPPGSQNGYRIRRNGKPYIEHEVEIGSDQVFSKFA